MSDSLWFLDNLEENESRLQQKDFTLDYDSSQNSGQKEWTPETMKSSSEDKSFQISSRSQEKLKTQNLVESKTTNVFDLLKDNESLRAALQNSLLESIKNGQNPEIRITVNNKPVGSISDLKQDTTNTSVDSSTQKENSNTVISFGNKDILLDNGKLVGDDDKSVINDSNGQNIEVNENSSPSQPKVYVILPPNQNNEFNVDPSLSGDTSAQRFKEVGSSVISGDTSAQRFKEVGSSVISGDTSSQRFKEVGSSVINLNDLLSSQENNLSKNGEITANVDLSSIIGSSEEMPKVELVIKLKDEREKTDQTAVPEEITSKSYSETEIARLKELLKNSATLESLDTQLQSGKEVRDIPIRSTSASPTRREARYKSVSNTEKSGNSSDLSTDWEDKTTDIYVRRDGAQCTRTVWSSPQGRRVETRCIRDERFAPRQAGSRLRDQGWPPRFGSLWNEINDDINKMFSYANRLF